MGNGIGELDLVAVHDLAVDVDATHRLVRISADLVDEILGRAGRIERRIDQINGGDPGEGSPTLLDRILDLSRVGPMRDDLLGIADRICVELEQEPPTVRAQALKAELEAAAAD